MSAGIFSTPLNQDSEGHAPDKVVKLPVSRDEPLDGPKARAAADAPDRGSDQHLQIGRILVLARRLSPNDVTRVLEKAKRGRLRFGEAALRMGLVQREDVDFALARQFAFPYVKRGDTCLSPDLLAAFAPNHPAVEQLRALRSQIALRADAAPRPHPVVAIVSPARGDGRSFVAANLAIVFAQLGQQTLLIDASFRSPAMHRFFKLEPHQGLSTALAGRIDTDCSQAIDAMPGLRVIPAGPMPPNPLELLERPRFGQLLDEAASRFEMVIVDTPADIEGPGAALLSNRAGAAILVARADTTRQVEARRFALTLERARTRLLGLVFNEKR